MHPWGLKVALRQRQIGPRAHIYIEMAFIFLIFLNISCASCVVTYLWPVSLIFSVGFAFHSFLSYSNALQSRAQHSKAEQRTAMPPAKRGGPATHTAQLRTLEDNTHTQHRTAQHSHTAQRTAEKCHTRRRAHRSTRAYRQYSSTQQNTPSAQLHAHSAQHSTAAAQHNYSDRARTAQFRAPSD